MISDSSLDELHRFASFLDMPARSFHGDHYDIPLDRRRRAVAAGALEVGSRELLRRLRDSGLRVRPQRVMADPSSN